MVTSIISAVPATMRAAVFYAPGEVRYETIATPSPGPGELLVKVKRALTCGTDLKCYRRGHPVLLGKLPSLFGHEFAGVVAAVGEGENQWQAGDRVVCANSAPCRSCFYCDNKQYNLCDNLKLLNGAYADYIVVPKAIAELNTYRVPAELPWEIAAFTEPLAVSLRGVTQMQVKPGQRVAVIGLGPIGQLLVACAKLQGAHVSAIARSASKRALAQSFGKADETIDIGQGFDPEAIKQAYTPEGRGFDVVIEAVGLPEIWEKAVGLARKGGRVNWFAGCKGGSTVTLDTRRLHYDEIQLISLFHHTPEHVKAAFELLCTGAINPTPLLKATRPMSEVVLALEAMERGQAMKTALVPG